MTTESRPTRSISPIKSILKKYISHKEPLWRNGNIKETRARDGFLNIIVYPFYCRIKNDDVEILLLWSEILMRRSWGFFHFVYSESTLEVFLCTILQCKKDPIYVFPEMKLRGRVPNFHPSIFCSKIGGPIVVIDKLPRETWMWKLGTRPRSFSSWNTCFKFSVQSLCNVIC
jgi:hypothetical protein